MKSATETPRPYGDFREPEEERQPESFRLPVSISEKLTQASEKFDCSKTFYVELALRNQFEKDGMSDGEQTKRKARRDPNEQQRS